MGKRSNLVKARREVREAAKASEVPVFAGRKMCVRDNELLAAGYRLALLLAKQTGAPEDAIARLLGIGFAALLGKADKERSAEICGLSDGILAAILEHMEEHSPRIVPPTEEEVKSVVAGP